MFSLCSTHLKLEDCSFCGKADIRNPLRYFLMNAGCFATYPMGIKSPIGYEHPPNPRLIPYAFKVGGLLFLRSICQSIGSTPFCTKNSLVLLKCLQPKNPRYADNGLG